jgi:hypothetical protein
MFWNREKMCGYILLPRCGDWYIGSPASEIPVWCGGLLSAVVVGAWELESAENRRILACLESEDREIGGRCRDVEEVVDHEAYFWISVKSVSKTDGIEALISYLLVDLENSTERITMACQSRRGS